jgi:hypothetical protein
MPDNMDRVRVRLVNKHVSITGVRYRLQHSWGSSEIWHVDIDGTTSSVPFDVADFDIAEVISGTIDKELPVGGTTLRWGDLAHDSTSIEPDRGERVVTDIEHANMICSDTQDFSRSHKVLFDIDHSVKVVESSPGHSHLYIDENLSWENIVLLMAAFVNVGLMEEGYMYASIQRGYTSLRVPWALKNSGVSIPEPSKVEEKKSSNFDLPPF